jgi:ribosome-associated toxin RatA of RatAB toxin-antitoxin module
MGNVTQYVDVEVPVTTAYNQWTQFESFPQFMDGVERIDQLSDTRTHWCTKIAGVTREFDADITEQHPDERVAWRTTDGPHQAGVVTFHRLDDGTTRVMLQMEYDPDSFVEKAGTALGIVQRTVEGDLNRFKEFIESRGGATGQWRGDVPRPPQTGEPRTGQPMGQQIPGQHGVQPVDAVRVVPALHGGRGAGGPADPHQDPLVHQDRRCDP